MIQAEGSNPVDVAEALGKYSTPTLAEVDPRVTALPSSVRPLYRPIHLAGQVYTVSAFPGDNLAVHLGLAAAPRDCVLVVATSAHEQAGFWGEIMMEAALARSIRGLVTDGAVRDTRALRERAFPVFCSGIAIPGTMKKERGRLNQPISIFGVLIRPGDFIVGDDDGAVIIPAEAAVRVLEQAQIRTDKETGFIEQLRRGALSVDLLNLREASPDA